MFTHLMETAQKLQTQPLLLFPEEEEMYKKINKVFDGKKEVAEAVKNLQFRLFND